MQSLSNQIQVRQIWLPPYCT